MPSEPIFKDRKRESSHNRRLPPSYIRQAGSYYEGNGHGCTPPRPSNGRYIGGHGPFRRSPYYNGETGSVAIQIIPTLPPPPPLKDDHNKDGGGDDQRSDLDRDHSFSQALKVEVLGCDLGKEMLVSSAVAGLEDEMPRKRSRLLWGQGLAKYEQEKVEGSMNSESILKVAGSISPATPCSAAACWSPGTVDRPFSKAKDADKDTSHHCETSALGPSNCLEGLHINLDQLHPASVLTSLLDDLLQPEDAYTGDSTFAGYTATSKLVLLKADVSKELEETECEIDLLENELKSLNDDGRCIPSQISFLLHDESSHIPCPMSVGVSKVSSDITPVIASAMAAAEQPDLPLSSCGKHEFDGKHANNDIPQMVLSTNGESSSSGNLERLFLDLGERAVVWNDSGDSYHLEGGDGCRISANLGMSSHGNENYNVVDLIIASNRDASRRASQAFDRALPNATQEFDIWGSARILSCRKNDMHVREKLALREQKIKFKERILALKFRALNHLWKDDLRLLSVRKQQTKSQKRFDLCSSSQSSLQKHRSSIRLRFTLPGNSRLVPTEDIVEFSSKLLSESQVKLYRNSLKMPALMLDEERGTMFITKNNLIEDPLSIDKESSMINPWNLEEKEVFMKKLATVGKDFAKISSFLSHKTTADCIEFYYKNHKSESFRDVKKQLDLRKQWRCLPTNAYMVTSGKKWNHNLNGASLDMLGAVSVAVAHSNDNRKNQPKHPARSIVPSYHSAKVLRGSYSTLERANSTGISGGGKEMAGTDVLACEAVSASVTSSSCPLEKINVGRMSRPLTPEVTETVDEEATCSDEGCGGLESVDWTDEEKSLLIRALSLYGKDFARISHCVGTKSREQCKTFFGKARKCLGLDWIRPAAGNGGTPVGDANGGRSDTYAAEIDSGICSTQSCSIMDVDFTNTATVSEVGGYNQGEINDMVDRPEFVLKVEKLKCEGESLQSKCESVPCHDHVELSRGRELSKVDNGVSVSFAEPSIASCTEGVQQKPQARVGIKCEEVELQQVPLTISKSGPGERRPKEIDTDKSNSVNFSGTADFSVKENESYLAAKLNNACSNNSPCRFSSHQHLLPLELISCSQKKSQMLSKGLPDPSSISSEATLKFDQHLHGLHQGSAAKDLYLQYLSRINSNHQIDQSINVLSGYHLQVLNQKELKMDTNMIINGNLSSQLNGFTVPCIVTEEQSTYRAGDVKLFGQILTNSFSVETDCKSLSPKQKKPSMVKTSFPHRKGSDDQSSLEEVPLQSYRYLDGSRIQTAFSLLPLEPSAVMRAACQGSILAGKPFFSTTKGISVSSTRGVATMNYHQANGKNNGFELVSGIQQAGRTAMVRLGVNMEVSDPVASLKMAKLLKQALNGG